jgi:eukaryotic-like serine/threonine-protein kinase
MTASYPEIGALLAGRYKLLRVIGRGGMGVVYEALHTLTEKRVALKWLHASVARHAEARQRLVREALATCRVSHPNVVEVYDVVQEGETVFLVMELLEGERLEDVLERGDTSLPQLISLLLPAMEGVAEAHRHGVIHRDIHPANIFLARSGSGGRVQPKVLDFGICKLGSDELGPALTQVGTTLGTPCYMSYEQLCNPRDVDPRTDVYSFAVILYRAATGRPPFEADSFTQLAIKIGTATPVPPKELRSDLPVSLERLILWAMSRDREQRIESMQTFLRELEPFASEHTYRSLMTEPEQPVPEVIAAGARAAKATLPAPALPMARWPARTGPALRSLSSLLALAALLLIGLASLTWWRERSEERLARARWRAHDLRAAVPALPLRTREQHDGEAMPELAPPPIAAAPTLPALGAPQAQEAPNEAGGAALAHGAARASGAEPQQETGRHAQPSLGALEPAPEAVPSRLLPERAKPAPTRSPAAAAPARPSQPARPFRAGVLRRTDL